MRKLVLGLAAMALLGFAVPVTADDGEQALPEDARSALRQLYANVAQAQGCELRFELVFGACDSEGELSDKIATLGARGEWFGRIISAQNGNMLVSAKGGALFDQEKDKWVKLDLYPKSKELGAFLKPPTHILATIVKKGKTFEWLSEDDSTDGQTVADAGTDDDSGTDVIGIPDTIRVTAGASEVSHFSSCVRNDTDCHRGKCSSG